MSIRNCFQSLRWFGFKVQVKPILTKNDFKLFHLSFVYSSLPLQTWTPSLWAVTGSPGAAGTYWTSWPGCAPAPPWRCTDVWLCRSPHCRKTLYQVTSVLSVGSVECVLGWRVFTCVCVYRLCSQSGDLTSVFCLSLASMAPPPLCNPTNRASSSTSFIRVPCSSMHCCTSWFTQSFLPFYIS